MNYNYSNYEPLVTKHKYRGYVSVTTFGMDPNQTEPYSVTVEFEHPNLDDARNAGIEWFKETVKGLDAIGRYFLPFAGPNEFVLGKNAAYSVSLSLVEIYDEVEYEYELLGTDMDTMNDKLELEDLLFYKSQLKNYKN